MSERALMERRLYEASLSGNVQALEALIEEDELILDRVSLTCFDDTRLHVAALRGHLNFVRALLSGKPKFATELNSLRCSPLHLASAEGHFEIVRALLKSNNDVCRARDLDGRNPLHLAAVKGRVEVARELIETRPDSIDDKLGRGDTVLHLCIKYNRLDSLKALVEYLRSSDKECFINSVDDDGNTILHLAATFKQLDTIEYLLGIKSVKEHGNLKNQNGSTALDVLEHCPNRDLKMMEIREVLMQAGIGRARDLQQSQMITTSTCDHNNNNRQTRSCWQSISRVCACFSVLDLSLISRYFVFNDGWFREVRGHLITAATLTATMAYQACLSPPGSFWQDDPDDKPLKQQLDDDDYGDYQYYSHQPGTYIIGSYGGLLNDSFDFFLLFNTVTLLASLSIILLALSDLPLKNKFFQWLLLITMFVTFGTMVGSYMVALRVTSPPELLGMPSLIISLFVYVAVCMIIAVLNTIFCLIWSWNKFQKSHLYKWLTEIKCPEVLIQLWPKRRPNPEASA